MIDSRSFEGDGPQLTGSVATAVRYLESLIDLRRVTPGEVLPSAAALAEEIGVNRVSVLQALQVLKREGLITVRRGRGGARIIGLEERSQSQRLARAVAKRGVLEQTALLREMIESGVARVAAERGLNAEALKRAKELVSEMRDVTDRDSYLALDTAFHEILTSATESEVLEKLASGLRQYFLVGLDAVKLPDERLRASTKEHERLLAAVERGDPSSAAEWAHRHAMGSRELIAEILALGEGGSLVGGNEKVE